MEYLNVSPKRYDKMTLSIKWIGMEIKQWIVIPSQEKKWFYVNNVGMSSENFLL